MRKELSVVELIVRRWWGQVAPSRVGHMRYGLLTLTLLTIGTLAMIATVRSASREDFSAFYILGRSGAAGDYPHDVAVGQHVTVTIGVANHEETDAAYTIAVMTGNQIIGVSPIIRLAKDTTWEQPVGFTMSTVGNDQEVEFILERAGQPSPYRLLRLWVDVRPPGREEKPVLATPGIRFLFGQHRPRPQPDSNRGAPRSRLGTP